MKELRINGRRLQERIAALGCIGALAGGGVCRLAFSRADKQARDHVEALMRQLRLEVHIDRIGNIAGVRQGEQAGAVVLAGSHIDTVGSAGMLDGSYGVMAALEAVETLNEACVRTRRPVAVMAFVNEEGARFMPDMMGSLIFRGDLSVEDARSITGIDGTTIGENIDRTGFAGDEPPGALPVHRYVELHIEQGPILEKEGCTIGVVEGVQGILWLAYTLRGATAHAGTTPVELRRDAAYVAGAVVQFVRRLALEIEGQCATVGSITLQPNLVNVVAEEARITVDLRNPDSGRLRMAAERLHAFVLETARAERVEVDRQIRVNVPPVSFDPSVIETVAAAAEGLGFRSRRMISGAGHDAQIMASVCRTGMIFVPSRGGLSHSIREDTAPEDLESGANVLLHTVLSLAQSN
jgi:N-carbamoyl-L-amino-acid hydrolase